ncbi:hypothetical protein N9Y42_08630 [Mariniblastus sp.]|nr:hypothetical protein [Mariniblastus sp.]
MSLFKKLFGGSDDAKPSSEELRSVPGAASYSIDGKVGYNMLDPMMQQFMGRCIGAVKKSGLRAGGTGQFSVSINDGEHELILDEFWARVCDNPDSQEQVMEDVIAAAQILAGNS